MPVCPEAGTAQVATWGLSWDEAGAAGASPWAASLGPACCSLHSWNPLVLACRHTCLRAPEAGGGGLRDRGGRGDAQECLHFLRQSCLQI